MNNLVNQRRKNVQEQNAVQKHFMREHALNFRNSPSRYIWLYKSLVEKGIDVQNGLLLSLNSCIEEGPVEEFDAIWATYENRFYKVSVVLEYGTQNLIEVEEFSDITSDIEFNAHKKGTGKSFGILALELINELK